MSNCLAYTLLLNHLHLYYLNIIDIVAGLQPVLPSSLTLPPPDSTSSSFDQCNLIDGVYQCSYHSLFDCNTNINIFYNDRSYPLTITAQFSVPVQTVNVVTYITSPRFTLNTMMAQIGPQQELINNEVRTLQHTETITTNFGYNDIMIPLLFEVYKINPLIINASSGVAVNRIIFCSKNG